MVYTTRMKLLLILLALLVSGAILGSAGCQSAGTMTSPVPVPNTTSTSTTAPIQTSTMPIPTPATATVPGVSFVKDIQTVFSGKCTACHNNSSRLGGLSLEPGSAYNNLVNAKSNESALNRVTAGSPDKSYLLNKVLGTQGQAGGSGLQMPSAGPRLPQDQINLIQQWISEGAPDN